MNGIITEKEVFLYPDSPCRELPDSVRVVMAQNGKPGIQLLLRTEGKEAVLELESDSFVPEWYRMHKVPVEYNTGDGQEQGGAMVILKDEKPSYAVRKAPFWVYDCLEPSQDGRIEVQDGLAAAYFCLCPSKDIEPGEYTLTLKAKLEEGTYSCRIQVQVYHVRIPEETFGVTNWFSLNAVSRFHHVQQGTPEFAEMLDRYIQTMRRVRQNMFYFELDEACVKSRNPYEFDFEYLRPMIEAFFRSGMKTLEIGPLLSRGFTENREPDMYTDTFKCAMAPEIPLESEEGYQITSLFIASLAGFLKKYGWESKTVFHIHDEPDVHYPDERTLEERRRQYYMAAGMLKKYLPQTKIIEAVKTTKFRGAVDIWVPVTSSYEEEKKDFDALVDLGEEVWTYVCCVPEGNWLNRFLDDAVLHSRLLFWGCEKNRLTGYLHWGWNQFQMGMDPFKGTSCPNHTGIGTNFPCGDAFLVYPGSDGPWLSMRLEAQRRGAEDLELLKLLREKDLKIHDQLIEEVYINNYTYQDDESVFQRVYERLLNELEE